MYCKAHIYLSPLDICLHIGQTLIAAYCLTRSIKLTWSERPIDIFFLTVFTVNSLNVDLAWVELSWEMSICVWSSDLPSKYFLPGRTQMQPCFPPSAIPPLLWMTTPSTVRLWTRLFASCGASTALNVSCVTATALPTRTIIAATTNPLKWRLVLCCIKNVFFLYVLYSFLFLSAWSNKQFLHCHHLLKTKFMKIMPPSQLLVDYTPFMSKETRLYMLW